MKSTAIALALLGTVTAGVALAQSADELLKAKGCMGCHDFGKKKVGPAFKDIAAKHKGNADAQAAIVAKLKDGKGHAKANASEAEIEAMVERALAAK